MHEIIISYTHIHAIYFLYSNMYNRNYNYKSPQHAMSFHFIHSNFISSQLHSLRSLRFLSISFSFTPLHSVLFFLRVTIATLSTQRGRPMASAKMKLRGHYTRWKSHSLRSLISPRSIQLSLQSTRSTHYHPILHLTSHQFHHHSLQSLRSFRSF